MAQAPTIDRSGQFTGYRERTMKSVREVLGTVGRVRTAVDVGAGEGWYAAEMMRQGLVDFCVPTDVSVRRTLELKPVLYDGKNLPFPDRRFELSYAVDVAHHASDPSAFLHELARVSSKWILIKDHTYKSSLGRSTLAFLDFMGNRRFGIESPGRYQHGWSWFGNLERNNLKLKTLMSPVHCHVGLTGALTNRMQFIALFCRC